jgi:3-oxoacyl-[acyl-carrier protein] reductase
VALVTGASRNIGRAIALALADAGANVVVNARRSLDEARDVVKEIEKRGGKAVASLADVTDEAGGDDDGALVHRHASGAWTSS